MFSEPTGYAREQNREDLRTLGKRPTSQLAAAVTSWGKFPRQHSDGLGASSRGIGPSRPERYHDSSSDDDSEWESASEDDYSSDESSGLAYGSSVHHPPPPPKSSISRQSTIVTAKPLEDIRPPHFLVQS